MKRLSLYLTIFHFLTLSLLSQSLSIFDVDTSSFPTMKAKFYAFDAEGKQITNLSAPDFEVKENGALRTVTNVTCPEVKEPLALSTLLVFDVSGSMCGDPLELEKKVANSWVNVLPLGISECAITSFSDDSYINSDFTTRKNYLQDRINTLFCMNGTNYDQAFLNDYTGAISIAKTGKHKKVIIFLSDGQPNFEPQTSKIIQEAINNGITIYSIIVKMNAPQCVKDISTQTGGIYFDNVSTDQDIEEAFLSLLSIAQGGDPCTIEWESGVSCKSSLTNVKIILTNLNLTSLVSYQSPNSSVARLEISPSCIIFKNVAPGNPKDTTITITARNADFHIINIKSSNPAFTVDETNFNLPKGQSIDLKVSYTPIDSSYTFTKFEFDCDPCPVSFYCSGGFPGHKPHVQTLKLTHPNGGEKFVVGTDTLITWEGIPETDTVKLEYSIDNGATWKLITNEATGLQYLWKNIPKPGSDKCLVRVTQIIGNESYDKNAKLLLTLTGNSNYHNHLTWKPNGSQIAAKGSENKAFIWNSYNGSLVYQLAGSYEYCYNLSWNKQENLIATSDYENITNIWDADNGDKLYTLNGPCGWQEDLAWDYEGKQLAVVGSNTANNGVGCILIWDATTGLLVQNLNGHANPVNQVRWNPVGKYIATSSQDGSIIIWNANNGDIISTFELKDNVNFIDWNPDGIRLASAGLDGSSVIWDAFSGSKILTLEETLNSKDEIKWSPDGNYVATSDGCDPIKIWDGYTGNLLKKFKESVGTVLACYFNWNPDGTLIASRSYYTKAFVWDVLSGNMIFILDHQSIISDIQWSPEGNRIATIGVDSTIKIWEIDDLSLQSDESDSVFSIVAPQPQAKDIDMHQCLVGSSKDSLVTGYISNAGTYKFRVDSIYFTGPDASAFKLIGGLPKFELMPGISKTSEFCFTPNKAGLHNAVINIITQSDTLTQNIIGEGVLPQFKLITDVIDFGTNEIGSVKDSTVALIKNISQNTVQIKDVVLLGPDKKQFEILTPGGFTLEPNESKQMTIRFHALYAGRTSCLIAFELNSAASPAIAQLYGRGIGGSVSIDNDSGYAGDLRKIKMKLGGVKINSLLSMASDFKATVRFQGSILAPLDHNQIKSISNDSTIIEITGKLGNDDVLAQLYLVVGLGYVPGTSIDILDFKWLDERGQEIDYDTETQSGTFTLLGICHEGGTRLLNPNGKVQLMLARPNPAGDEVEIGYELVESGRTQLFIINMNGERVKTLFDKEISSFGVNSEKITTSELSSGSYLVVLQTPTEMKSIKLEVIK